MVFTEYLKLPWNKGIIWHYTERLQKDTSKFWCSRLRVFSIPSFSSPWQTSGEHTKYQTFRKARYFIPILWHQSSVYLDKKTPDTRILKHPGRACSFELMFGTFGQPNRKSYSKWAKQNLQQTWTGVLCFHWFHILFLEDLHKIWWYIPFGVATFCQPPIISRLSHRDSITFS